MPNAGREERPQGSLPGVGAGRGDVHAVLHAVHLFDVRGHLLELVQRLRGMVPAGLLGDIGAVVQHMAVHVPRHAQLLAVDLACLQRTGGEVAQIEVLRHRREGVGEVGHPRGAHLDDVRHGAGCDGGLDLVMCGGPRDGGHCDVDVRVFLLESFDEITQQVAFVAHRPDRQVAGGGFGIDAGHGGVSGAIGSIVRTAACAHAEQQRCACEHGRGGFPRCMLHCSSLNFRCNLTA